MAEALLLSLHAKWQRLVPFTVELSWGPFPAALRESDERQFGKRVYLGGVQSGMNYVGSVFYRAPVRG